MGLRYEWMITIASISKPVTTEILVLNWKIECYGIKWNLKTNDLFQSETIAFGFTLKRLRNGRSFREYNNLNFFEKGKQILRKSTLKILEVKKL